MTKELQEWERPLVPRGGLSYRAPYIVDEHSRTVRLDGSIPFKVYSFIGACDGGDWIKNYIAGKFGVEDGAVCAVAFASVAPGAVRLDITDICAIEAASPTSNPWSKDFTVQNGKLLPHAQSCALERRIMGLEDALLRHFAGESGTKTMAEFAGTPQFETYLGIKPNLGEASIPVRLAYGV